MAVSPSPVPFDPNSRNIHVGPQSDFRYDANGPREAVVPFGTWVMGAGSLGTVQSGNIKESADKKERGDGAGGTEAITYSGLKFEAKVTVNYRVVGTTGHGPPKIGDFVQFRVPLQDALDLNEVPAGGQPLPAAWETLFFSVDDIDFKFSNGDYATFDLSATHNRSLHGDMTVISAQVTAEGTVLAANPITAPVNVPAWVTGRSYEVGDRVQGTEGNVYVCTTAHVSATTTKPISGADYDNVWELPA